MVLMIFFVFSGFGETWSHQVKVGQTSGGGSRGGEVWWHHLWANGPKIASSCSARTVQAQTPLMSQVFFLETEKLFFSFLPPITSGVLTQRSQYMFMLSFWINIVDLCFANSSLIQEDASVNDKAVHRLKLKIILMFFWDSGRGSGERV